MAINFRIIRQGDSWRQKIYGMGNLMPFPIKKPYRKSAGRIVICLSPVLKGKDGCHEKRK